MERMIHVEQQPVFLMPVKQVSEKERTIVGVILDICSPDDDAPDFGLIDLIEIATQLLSLLPL